MLIQRVWSEKLGLDDPLPEDYMEEWQELVGKLVDVDRVKFSRAACGDSPCQLHVFCDASVKAYGAVTYLVSEGQSQIFMSKDKVTPLSSRTVVLKLFGVITPRQCYDRSSLPLIPFPFSYVKLKEKRYWDA